MVGQWKGIENAGQMKLLFKGSVVSSFLSCSSQVHSTTVFLSASKAENVGMSWKDREGKTS